MAAAEGMRLAMSFACEYLVYRKMTGKKRAKEEIACVARIHIVSKSDG